MKKETKDNIKFFTIGWFRMVIILFLCCITVGIGGLFIVHPVLISYLTNNWYWCFMYIYVIILFPPLAFTFFLGFTYVADWV